MKLATAEVAVDLVPMTSNDIARGMELVNLVGWNQIAADWDMMLRQGNGLGIRLVDGELVATSLILRYPPNAGWISMVIVDPRFRGIGLARRLLDAAVEILEREGFVAALDATPLGRGLYSRLGFEKYASITRWRGQGKGGVGPQPVPATGVESIAAAKVAREAFGHDNRGVLAELAQHGWTWSTPGESGYAWARPGRTATHLGPVVAHSEAATLVLCETALDALGGPVVLDVPNDQRELSDLLVSRGFEPERSFHRMGKAPPGTLRLNESLRVTAGPELG